MMSTGIASKNNTDTLVDGNKNVGGLIGLNLGYVRENCSYGISKGEINIGGLIGKNRKYSNKDYSGEVYNCISKNVVKGTKFVGGD